MEDCSPETRRHRRAAAIPAVAVAALALGAPLSAEAGVHRKPPSWCKPRGALAARAMPSRIRLADCDLRGRTVRGANGLAAVVPKDGTSVTAHALRTDGSAELRVRVDRRAKTITITTRGAREPQGRPRQFRAPLDPCRDGAYRLEPSKWTKGTTVEWRYHPGTGGQPGTSVSTGVSSVVNAGTDCTADHRFSPAPAITARYAGETGTEPNVDGQAGCGQRDRANIFGWIPLPDAEPEVLAATCIWFNGPTTVETDMALQTQGKKWWAGKASGGTCPAGSYDASAVATHEAGHVFGLSHIEGSQHAKLTMAPSVAACDDGPATLGKGDYDGLIALYGGR
ncbi:matrixin family metalloprotease [Actinomadura rubrisoli]|uniref:Matrixin family metalloprotease n=1 Tax=Actinomadura rubrisoli TaxID=2530368 RepID=A0A4V2YYN6_9ACTN|nr:matrixin family metalloprotease [Actinomadura rubrisoli]TDD93877.1 matrixin family metalloprotease [Actinomadura rubrisoli]